MSRFLPLVVFMIWLSGPASPAMDGISSLQGVGYFLGAYVVLVLILRLWSRTVARRAHLGHLQRRLRKFNRMIYAGRMMIPVWFAVGIFALGWKSLALAAMSQTYLGRLPIDSPGLIVGCLPAFAAWMGLWWSQYPADQALREQNLLSQLDDNLPVHAPPSFWVYFQVNLRLQLLFVIVPVMVLVVFRDAMALTVGPLLNQLSWLKGQEALVGVGISLLSAGAIFLIAPELLRHVLQTESMPDCPLRKRLVAVCQRNRVGYRDVLLWRTRNQMGNAAVMGVVPRFRYILLSDLLLETMSDEQIEAVFAHEVGHVRHRHLLWLVGSLAGLMFLVCGPGQWVATVLDEIAKHHPWLTENVQAISLMGLALAIYALVFGYVSRRLERQADVFAARTIQMDYLASLEASPPLAAEVSGELAAGGAGGVAGVMGATAVLPAMVKLTGAAKTFVGAHGAATFCSALERVAAVNNIPIAARSWCHGSIAKRMRFIIELGNDRTRTGGFDRSMTRLFVVLALCICGLGVWTALVML